MAWNAQLPDYFKQFDITGGILTANLPEELASPTGSTTSQDGGQLQDQIDGQLAQLQNQISSIVGASAPGGQAPGVNPTTPGSSITGQATIPQSLMWALTSPLIMSNT